MISYRTPLHLVSILALACAVAFLLATGHMLASAVVALAPMVVFAFQRAQTAIAQRPRALLIATTFWVASIASAFVWRDRSTTQLYSNPLDGAALLRVGLIALTIWLAAATLAQLGIREPVPLPIVFLGAYAVVATVAAAVSPHKLNAGYRVVEVVAGVLAALAAMSLLRQQAGRLMLRVTINLITILVVVIWIEALLFPHRAWTPEFGTLRYTLNGYLPSFSSNTVGVFGGILLLWSLAQLLENRSTGWSRWWSLLPPWPGFALGVATLVASQYRTGILGAIAAATTMLLARRRYRLVVALGLIFALAVAYVGTGRVQSKASEAFAKGQPQLVHSLDSRTVYWNASLRLAEQRPLFGWGLNVGGREALESIGQDDTAGVHGTWPQALVDTGVTGVLCLFSAFVAALVTAVRVVIRNPWDPLGGAVLAMLIFLAIRSITGPTVDSFNELFPLFTALAITAAQIRPPRRRASLRSV